MFLHTDPDEQ